MKLLGWTLAAGLMLVAAGESKAQLMIGNPYTGSGVMIGGGGVTVTNGLGYSPYNYGSGGIGAPVGGYYSSGYVAPGYVGSYGLGGFGGYTATSYASPYYGYRSYGYGYPRVYRRGLFGRRYRW